MKTFIPAAFSFGYIKQLLAVCLAVLLCNTGTAQNKDALSFFSQQPDSTETFFSMQKRFNDFNIAGNIKNGVIIKDGKKQKVPNWKIFKRYEYYAEQRVNRITGEFPNTNSLLEYNKSLNGLNKISNYTASWVNLGTNTSSGGYAGLGRINCVAFHPSDPNTYWAGSPSGGIWKTTDGGSSWVILNNSQQVLGVSDIVLANDFATSNTMYIVTGDRDGGSMWSLGGGQAADNVSIGILKSTNGGQTWGTTGLTYAPSSSRIVYRLLAHPSNNQILIASTNNGIYKSTDAGASWTQKNTNRFIDMEFKPGGPATVYASTYGYSSTYVSKSTDTGDNWTLTSTITNGRRSELAVSANNPAVAYLLVCNSGGGLFGVYKSTDSGSSFSQINSNTSQNMLGYYSDGSGGTTGQGTYDLCIAASPTDANTVFIGGVNTWKSTDGGVTWNINNMWTDYSGYNFSGAPVAHADKHVLSFQSGTALFEGNDGGIYKTTNGGTSWNDKTIGIVISQIYRIGISNTDATKILAGLQDNGSKKYNGAVSTWSDVYGGDGMECIIDFNNAASYMYVTYVNGEIQRSTNGFSTSYTTQISANIPGGQPTGAWVTPYIMSPANSAILYAGYDQVWKTTNYGDSWTSASQQLSASTKLRSLAIAPSNTNVLYAADLTQMWKTTDGGATNWSAITLPSNSNSITYIAVKNNDPNTVWITYGGYSDGAKVYESTDGGGTWSNISAGLPNLPVMCITYYKTITDRKILFAGTDVGVYVKDGANNWSSFSNGLPNVVVPEMEIFYQSGADKLRAGTFGRGLWETEIASIFPVELTGFTAKSDGGNVTLNWSTATEVSNYGFEIQRAVSSGNHSETNWQKTGFVRGSGNSNSPRSYSFTDKTIKESGKYLYRLKQLDETGSFEYSKQIEVELGPVKNYTLRQNYPNPFNPLTVIGYSLPAAGKVTLKVYDILGKEIAELVNEEKPAGQYEVKFDASRLTSGVYLYTLKAGNYSETKKMVVIK